jgi:glycosyltransferase involved in cell wall biosynthesis
MIAGLVSCIVPTFNGARHLAPCLDSMLAQTYQPVEIIVVDDGSTDGTSDLVASYAERVRYVHQPNRGPAAARNTGIAAARGEFVAFNDADDLWHPEKLARQVAHLARMPSRGVSVTHIRNFVDEGAPSGMVACVEPRFLAPQPGVVVPCMLVRRTVLDSVGPFDVDLAHASGADWFVRARTRGVVVECLPDVLTERRLHATNRSRELAQSSCDEYLRLVKRHLDGRR